MSSRIASLMVLLTVALVLLGCSSGAIAGNVQAEGAAEGEGEGRDEGPPRPTKTIMLPGDVTLEMIRIPAGTFLMGQAGEEVPVHRVTLTKDFWLSKHEITQAQWQAVMGTNPSYFTGDGQRPVEQVSWDGAQTFIRNLNKAHPGSTFRLPTEAEWEYACRAGTASVYSCGDDAGQLAEYAWYAKNSDSTTHSVGQKLPNAWGLYDMHGNVLEWVEDRYGPYSTGAQTDPMGPTSGSFRAMRGGSWSGYASYCRSASRYDGNGLPGFTSSDISLGFRLAKD